MKLLLICLAVSLYLTLSEPCEDQLPFQNGGICINEGDICCVCSDITCEGCVVDDCPVDTTLAPDTTSAPDTTLAPDTTSAETTTAKPETTVFGTTATGKSCICPTKSSSKSGSKSVSKSGSKSASKESKKSSSKEEGLGLGDCDCDGGMVELRFIYSGAFTDVDIGIYDAEDLSSSVCSFANVTTFDEVTCNVYDVGLTKFSKNTRFIINRNDGSECAATYHTSCSRDIVGIVMDECSELVVSGWADAKGGDCDDGNRRRRRMMRRLKGSKGSKSGSKGSKGSGSKSASKSVSDSVEATGFMTTFEEECICDESSESESKDSSRSESKGSKGSKSSKKSSDSSASVPCSKDSSSSSSDGAKAGKSKGKYYSKVLDDDDDDDAQAAALAVNENESMNASDMLTDGSARFSGLFVWILVVCGLLCGFV